MASKFKIINRDLSWIKFNYRVLQEGMDQDLPLYDRIKFLGIFSSNLDEFYRVRVATLQRIGRIQKTKLSKELDFDVEEVIAEIKKTLNPQLDEYGKYLRNTILKELEENRIILYMNRKIEESLYDGMRYIFNHRISAFLTPVMIEEGNSKEFSIFNGELFFAVKLISNEKKEQIAFINIPSTILPRFYLIDNSDKNFHYVLLDDILKASMGQIFPNYIVQECISVKLNRDADLNIEDEYSGDLVEKIQKQIKKRDIGPPVRFLYDSSISDKFLAELLSLLKIDEQDSVKGGQYHNLNDLMTLPNPAFPLLSSKSPKAILKKELYKKQSVKHVIESKDQLLYFPYHSFDSVLRLFNEAALDSSVTKIYVTLYRIAKESILGNALISAAKNGKKVVVFMEIKARFDEANNLHWSSKLEEAGASVIYSMPGLKVHAKVALFERKTEKGKIERYAYLGTGNLNESTSQYYTDLGLITKNKDFTDDLNSLFRYLHKQKKVEAFKKLKVSRFNMKDHFINLIDREIEHKQNGRKAGITIKLNNLEHKEMIEKLYEASNAGVKIDLIIRGICTLRPQLKGQSENIRLFRLVDGYLEHPRILHFHNNGQDEIYLGSADWMTRNLEHRIEVIFPLLQKDLIQEVKHYLNLQLRDNQKMRELDDEQNDIVLNSDIKRIRRAQKDIYHWVMALETSSNVSKGIRHDK